MFNHDSKHKGEIMKRKFAFRYWATLVLMAGLLVVATIQVEDAFAQDDGEEPPPVIVSEPDEVPPPVIVSELDETLVSEYWQRVDAWVQSSILVWTGAAIAIAATVSAMKSLLLAPLRDNIPGFKQVLWNGFTIYQAITLALVAVLAYLGFETDYINVFKDTPIPYLADANGVIHALVSVAGISGISIFSHEIFDRVVA